MDANARSFATDKNTVLERVAAAREEAHASALATAEAEHRAQDAEAELARVRSARAQLEADLERAAERLSQREEALNLSEAARTQLEQGLHEQEQVHIRLTEEAAQQRQEQHALVQVRRELELEVQQREQELQESESQARDLASALQSLRQEMESAQAERRAVQERFDEQAERWEAAEALLQQQLHKADTQAAAQQEEQVQLQQELRAQSEAVVRLEEQLAQLREQQARDTDALQQQSELINAQEAEMRSIDEARRAAEQALQAAEERIGVQEEQLRDLAEAKQQARELQFALEQQVEELAESRAAAAALRGDLTARAAELERTQSELQQVRQQEQTARDTAAEARRSADNTLREKELAHVREVHALQSAMDLKAAKIASLSSLNDDLHLNASHAAQTIASLKAHQVDRGTAAMQATQEAQGALEALRAQLASRDADLRVLAAQLEASKASTSEAQAREIACVAQEVSLKNKLAELETALATQKSEYEAQWAARQKEMERILSQTNAEQSRRVNELQVASASHAQAESALREQVAKLTQDLASLKAQSLDELRQAHQNNEDVLAVEQRRAEGLAKRLSDAQVKADASAQEVGKLMLRLGEVQKRLLYVENDRKTLKVEASKRASAATLEVENKNLRAEVFDLRITQDNQALTIKHLHQRQQMLTGQALADANHPGQQAMLMAASTANGGMFGATTMGGGNGHSNAKAEAKWAAERSVLFEQRDLLVTQLKRVTDSHETMQAALRRREERDKESKERRNRQRVETQQTIEQLQSQLIQERARVKTLELSPRGGALRLESLDGQTNSGESSKAGPSPSAPLLPGFDASPEDYRALMARFRDLRQQLLVAQTSVRDSDSALVRERDAALADALKYQHSLQQALEEVRQAKVGEQHVQALLQQSEAELRRAQDRVRELQTQLAEATANLGASSMQVHELEERRAVSSTERVHLLAQVADRDQLSEQLAAAQRKIAKLEESSRSIASEMGLYRESLASAEEAHRAAMSTASAEQRAMQQQLSRAEQERSHAASEVTVLRERAAEHAQRFAALQADFTQAEQANKTLRAELDSSQQAVSRLRRLVSDAHHRSDKVRKTLLRKLDLLRSEQQLHKQKVTEGLHAAFAALQRDMTEQMLNIVKVAAASQNKASAAAVRPMTAVPASAAARPAASPQGSPLSQSLLQSSLFLPKPSPSPSPLRQTVQQQKQQQQSQRPSVPKVAPVASAGGVSSPTRTLFAATPAASGATVAASPAPKQQQPAAAGRTVTTTTTTSSHTSSSLRAVYSSRGAGAGQATPLAGMSASLANFLASSRQARPTTTAAATPVAESTLGRGRQ
jgi:chromosome segregation ATPase